jgi:ABC-2 type transport system permease protein
MTASAPQAGAGRRASLERVLELVRKEWKQIFRDSRLARLVIVAPILQLIVFGYAVSTDIRNTTTFVVDHDHTRASRELVAAFTASGYFREVGRGTRSADLGRALDRGRAIVGLEIPAGFARDLASGDARVQLLFDGTNSNVATVAKGYAERIVLAYALRQPGAPAGLPIELRERAWFNPELASRNYNVPAVMGAIMMLICLNLTALAVVREREIGTLEQLMVSPLTPRELIAGKTIPFAVIGLFDVALITAVALLWFRVPFIGFWPLLVLASLLYLLSGLGLGLLISTVSATQQEAFLSSFLVFMPTMLLSGFMFPVASMPEAFQWLTLVNPMRHYLVIVRGIFLKGTGLGALWPEYAALAAIGGALLAIATTRFRKTIG